MPQAFFAAPQTKKPLNILPHGAERGNDLKISSMKTCFIATMIIVSVFMFSCSKSIEENHKSPIEVSARSTLESKMEKQYYLDLNWDGAVVKKENGVDLFIEIPTKKNRRKKLVYARDGQIEKYNYYELKFSAENQKFKSGSLVLSGINNNVLNEYAIVNNKIIG